MLKYSEKLVKNSLEKATTFMKKNEPIKGHTGLQAVLAAEQSQGRAGMLAGTGDHRRPKGCQARPGIWGSSVAKAGPENPDALPHHVSPPEPALGRGCRAADAPAQARPMV